MIFFWTVLIICILFFSSQIVFLFLYFIMAQFLIAFKNNHISKTKAMILLCLFNALTFYGATVLTDLIFGLQINQLMIMILKGNYILYAFIILLEGLLVAAALIQIFSIANKRLSKLPDSDFVL